MVKLKKKQIEKILSGHDDLKLFLDSIKSMKKEEGKCSNVHCSHCPFLMMKIHVESNTSDCYTFVLEHKLKEEYEYTDEEISISKNNIKKIKKVIKKLLT